MWNNRKIRISVAKMKSSITSWLTCAGSSHRLLNSSFACARKALTANKETIPQIMSTSFYILHSDGKTWCHRWDWSYMCWVPQADVCSKNTMQFDRSLWRQHSSHFWWYPLFVLFHFQTGCCAVTTLLPCHNHLAEYVIMTYVWLLQAMMGHMGQTDWCKNQLDSWIMQSELRSWLQCAHIDYMNNSNQSSF